MINTETRLHTGMGDATELEKPYRPGLYEEVGAAHKACLLNALISC